MSAALAFSTLGCGELELAEVLALAAARRLPAVELRTLGGTTDILGYFRQTFGRPEDLRSLVAASGVGIASVDTSVEAMTAGEADRRWLEALLPWVVATGARRIRVFDGGQSGSAQEIATAGDLVQWWKHFCASQGRSVEMAIETHDALAKPEALQRFLDAVPEGRILWDTYHTWHAGAEPPSTTWQRLHGRTSHLHVKDSRVTASTRSYVPPGQGDYPFEELIGRLAADRFEGTISLEWERFWHPELPPLAAALDGFQNVFSPRSGATFLTPGG